MFPMTTCCMHYDITGEHMKPTTRMWTMFIGPSTTTEPLEVGVVADDEGTAIIHAMKAREKFLKGWWIK